MSTNGADSWSPASFPAHGAIIKLVVDPITSGKLYALPRKAAFTEVYRSTDGGETWSVTGPATPFIQAIAIDARSAGTQYGGSNATLDQIPLRLPPAVDNSGWFASSMGSQGIPATVLE